MLKSLSHRAKVFFVSQLVVLTACTHTTSGKETQDQIHADTPLIQNLKTVSPQWLQLQHSLVRLRLDHPSQHSSFGSGFFYQSKELLITSLHTFEGHSCLEEKSCSIYLGFARSEKQVEEIKIRVQVALRDPEKDLLYLKVPPLPGWTSARPLTAPSHAHLISDTHPQKMMAAGFYQDSEELTFSHGISRGKDAQVTVTTAIVGHGFSGAPVLNEKGEVLGVVSSYHPLRNQKSIGLARFVDLH